MTNQHSHRSLFTASQVRTVDRPLMVGGEEPLVANPEINLIRKDGRIVAIEILCRCGETITLECELEGDDGASDSSMTNGQRVAP